MWKRVENRYPHFCHRPTVACLPSFFAGLLAIYSFWFLLLVPISCLFARRYLLLAASLFALGFLRSVFAPIPGPALVPGEYEVTGIVTQTPNLRLNTQSFVIRSEERKLLITARASQWVMAGDCVKVTGTVLPIKSESRAYWIRRGVSQSMFVVFGGSVELITPGRGLAAIGSEWRTRTWSRLVTHLPKERAGLAMGIVAGQQGLVPPQTHENMKRAGTLHLLATSGFNVLLLAGALMFLIAHLPVPKPVQCALAIALLLIYCFAVGSKPPVLRATAMASTFFAIQAFRRTPDTLSLLALAAIGFALLEPAAVLDAGYQLSFLAVAALILFFPPANRALVKRTASVRSGVAKMVARLVGASLIVTVIAQLGSAPILAYHFGGISIVAPIANLLTAATVPFVYAGVGLGQLFSYVHDSVSYGFDFGVAGVACSWIEWINSALGSPAWSFLEFEPIPGWAAATLVGIFLLSSRPYVVRPDEMVDEDIL